jgi:hydroxyacylglutathione hydrolase
VTAETAGAPNPIVETIPVGPLQCNCTILGDPASGEALVIDPGDEPERILQALRARRLTPVALLHTHAHFDHIGGSRRVKETTSAPIRLHAADFPLYDALPTQAAHFGLSAEDPLPPDRPVEDGETIRFGAFAVTAIHTPGHTPGSTCYRLHGGSGDLGVLFAGDTLFLRSIGRTDLWGGDTDTILASIRERLFTLPAHLPVVCGHGPGTTIGDEKRFNPFAGEGAARPSL